MTTIIKLRRDTAANWTSANPILADGEPGLESDTLKIKYGDGSTLWANLPYSDQGITGSWSFSGSTMSIGEEGTIKTQVNAGYAPNINIELDSSELQPIIYSFKSDGQFVIPTTGGIQYANGTPFSGEIPASLANSSASLTLNADGTLEFPDNTIDAGNNSLNITSGANVELSWLSANSPNPGDVYKTSLSSNANGTYVKTYISGANTHQWEFNTNGDLVLPTDGGINFNYGYIDQDSPNSVMRISAGANLSISTDEDSKTWQFNTNGSINFPNLTVDIHNGGNQQAQTLQFGDDTQQAIITGPTPSVDTNAQRLIIQGQRGSGLGEGGDVYLWGGDSDVNGGDIKIYAGDADVSGSGGYINIDAGNGPDSGGQLSLSGGGSSNGQGGTVSISAGGGGTDGGAVNINGGGAGANQGGNIALTGGYGAANGGEVRLTGGSAGTGIPGYGNVALVSGASTWTFDNSGNFTAPGSINVGNMSIGDLPGYITAEANIGIILNTSGSDGGFVVDYLKEDGNANTSGGELAFSSETGNATYRISLSDDLGDGFATKIWRFDGTGNLTLPSNTFSVNYANGTQVSLGGGGGVQSEIANGVSNVNIPTSGGAVEVTAGTQHWAFGTDGTLTAPNDSQIVPAGNNFNIYTNGVNGAVQFFTDVTGNNHNWSFDGYGFTQLPFSQGFTNTAVITSVGAGNIMLQAGAGPTQNFLFGSDGLLTLPGGNVTIGNQFGDQAIFSNNESFGVVSIGNAATVVQWNDDISNTSLLSAIYVNGPGGNVGDIQIRTGDISNANVWTFGNDGNFHLANGNSVIQSVSNNAGDGSGLSTLNLIPDNITGDDRYLIIDPTGPAHLHLRAGGTQDASNALLFLGGELAYTMIDDFNHEVQIKSYDSTNTASYSWTFENDGTLTIPGNLVASGASPAPTLSGFSSLGAIDSITVGTSNAVSLSSGGNIDFSQGQQIRPAGSTIIGMYSNSAGNDGVGIYTNVSSDLFNQANVNITANSATTPKTWAFDKTGNITFPDASVQTTAWTGTAATVDITNTNGLSTVYYPTFVESRTTGQIVRADVDLSYRTDTNTLSAGNLSVSGTIEAAGKIGYSSGSSVTQTTNRGQGVTINTLAGEITLVSDTIAAGDSDVLFVGCNKVDSTSDIVLVQVTSYNPGTYLPIAQPTSTPFAGFQLSLTNISAFASPTEAVTIRFMIIKAPSA